MKQVMSLYHLLISVFIIFLDVLTHCQYIIPFVPEQGDSYYHIPRYPPRYQESGSNAYCALMPSYGNCNYVPGIPRWFFNVTAMQCQGFMYSGCGGNRNRFLTRQNCESTCYTDAELLAQLTVAPSDSSIGGILVPEPPDTRGDGRITVDVCLAEKSKGYDCEGEPAVQRWYWSQNKWDCLAFIFRGCGGSVNRFRTKRACLERCQPCKQ